MRSGIGERPALPAGEAEVDVSVVVVSYNTRELTLACVRSVLEQTRAITLEVLVVDNHSRDGSAAAIAAALPEVRLIANTENRGFAAANNQALRVARGRYLLLLNPDTLVIDGAVEKMVAYLDARPDVGCAGCQVLRDADTIQQTCFRFPSVLHVLLDLTGLARRFPQSRLLGRSWMRWWERRSERDVDVVSGMFMLVRREAAQQVGPLDEDYFVYGEEADWCWRLRRQGWRCVFTPVARIIHREGGGQSTRQVSVRMYVQLQKSILIFLRKHRGRASWLAARLLFALAMTMRYAMGAPTGWLTRSATRCARARRAGAAARFHWFGAEPTP